MVRRDPVERSSRLHAKHGGSVCATMPVNEQVGLHAEGRIAFDFDGSILLNGVPVASVTRLNTSAVRVEVL